MGSRTAWPAGRHANRRRTRLLSRRATGWWKDCLTYAIGARSMRSNVEDEACAFADIEDGQMQDRKVARWVRTKFCGTGPATVRLNIVQLGVRSVGSSENP